MAAEVKTEIASPTGTGDDGVFPADVVFEILLRLPVKSLCRFRCVSPLWRALIADPLFVSSHFDRSSAHPVKLMFLNKRPSGGSGFSVWGREEETSAAGDDDDGKTFFLMEGSSSDEVNLSFHGRIPGNGYCSSQSAGGLICFDSEDGIHVGNPSTGESITLRVTAGGNVYEGISVLGYDPIERKHVVLCSMDREVRILTLGQRVWRKLDCGDLRFEEATCINGVLHVRCFVGDDKPYNPCLLLFDVRLEAFRVVSTLTGHWTGMVNEFIEFDTTISVVRDSYIGGSSSPDFDLWVLEDSEQNPWSRKSIPIPSHLMNSFNQSGLAEALLTRVGDVLFVPHGPALMYLFNLTDESVTKMKLSRFIQHFPRRRSLAITHHVDSILSLQSFHID